MKKQRVLVGMSGGVDSSSTAAILLEQGYEVIGLTISTIKTDDSCRPENNGTSCCSAQAMTDAVNVAKQLGIEHYFADFTSEFKSNIIDYFADEYFAGRTPNPCVECNPKIKWNLMLQKAAKLDCSYFATGHYSKVSKDERSCRYFLKKAYDIAKDQSYFLWKLSQEQLSKTLFPLGDLKKSEVREIAKKHNLPVHNKQESQEICFIPDNDYHEFLTKYFPDKISVGANGKILFRGRVVGSHLGYPFYTIGQRKGLGISHQVPLYVKSINPQENILEVEEVEGILNTRLLAKNLSFMRDEKFENSKTYIAKIRYRDSGEEAVCKAYESHTLEVEFAKPRKAITPGQSVVIYDGDELVAGAIISEVLE